VSRFLLSLFIMDNINRWPSIAMPVLTTFFCEFVRREVVVRKVRSASSHKSRCCCFVFNLATNEEKHNKYIHDGSDKEKDEESSRSDMYCMIDPCFIPSSKKQQNSVRQTGWELATAKPIGPSHYHSIMARDCTSMIVWHWRQRGNL
jgi:hypothetical protein